MPDPMILVPRPLSMWANIDDERHIVQIIGLTVGPQYETRVVAQWGHKPEGKFTVPLNDWADLWVPE